MQPVTAILHIAIAKKLAVVCDGSLLLLDYESLEEYTMPGLKVCCPCCHSQHSTTEEAHQWPSHCYVLV